MPTRIWRCRIPVWAWEDLVVSHELIDHVHQRIEEIASKQGRIKVKIGTRGRWVWVSVDEVTERLRAREEATP